jgi:hypothetical protein
MEAKIGASPFSTLTAFDPDAHLDVMVAALARFANFTNTVEAGVWGDMLHSTVKNVDEEVFNDAARLAEADAYNDIVDANMNNAVLPRFRRGMQDINAVNSSAFILGQAFLEAEATRDKSKFLADLFLQQDKERTAVITSGMEQKIKLLAFQAEVEQILLRLTIDQARIAIVAKKEETDQDIHLSELDGRWDLEIFNYGGNFLGSIGSASVRTGAQSTPQGGGMGLAMAGIGAAVMIGAMMMM